MCTIFDWISFQALIFSVYLNVLIRYMYYLAVFRQYLDIERLHGPLTSAILHYQCCCCSFDHYGNVSWNCDWWKTNSCEIFKLRRSALWIFQQPHARAIRVINTNIATEINSCSLSVSTCFFKYPSISLSMHIFKKSNVFFFAVDINYDSKYVLLCAQSELFSAST